MNRVEDLVARTMRRHVHPEADIVHSSQTPMRADEQGYSGTPLTRQLIVFRTSVGMLRTATLITKEAVLVERLALDRLLAQGQCVPFSHTLDLTTDAPALVCQQDLQASGAYAPPDLQRQVARCLARIHMANRGRAAELGWLPRANEAYFADVILADFREQVARARERPAFLAQIGDVARQMEDAVEPFLTSMLALWEAVETHTLIHADMMDTHVLEYEGRPYLIDWGQARYGSFYLDLPNYFTPATVDSTARRSPIWASPSLRRYSCNVIARLGAIPASNTWASCCISGLQANLTHYRGHFCSNSSTVQ